MTAERFSINYLSTEITILIEYNAEAMSVVSGMPHKMPIEPVRACIISKAIIWLFKSPKKDELYAIKTRINESELPV